VFPGRLFLGQTPGLRPSFNEPRGADRIERRRQDRCHWVHDFKFTGPAHEQDARDRPGTAHLWYLWYQVIIAQGDATALCRTSRLSPSTSQPYSGQHFPTVRKRSKKLEDPPLSNIRNSVTDQPRADPVVEAECVPAGRDRVAIWEATTSNQSQEARCESARAQRDDALSIFVAWPVERLRGGRSAWRRASRRSRVTRRCSSIFRRQGDRYSVDPRDNHVPGGPRSGFIGPEAERSWMMESSLTHARVRKGAASITTMPHEQFKLLSRGKDRGAPGKQCLRLSDGDFLP